MHPFQISCAVYSSLQVCYPDVWCFLVFILALFGSTSALWLWPPLPVAPLPKCPLPLPLPLWNTFTGRVLTVSVVSADLTVAAATVVPVPFCEDALYSVHCICQLQDILHVSSTQLLVCNCSPNIVWQFCCLYVTYSFFAAACLHRLLLMCAY